jgi:hypothetical protein
LSTGSTSTNFVSGVLFEPHNASANYLNRYHPSHPIVSSSINLETEKDFGGFFTPDKEGILNYERVSSTYSINTDKLSANQVYIFPDPSIYGTGRGDSLDDHANVLTHVDDNEDIKGNKLSQTLYGDVANDQAVQKFYPYQSREETLKLHPLGISRYSDNVDFWEGDEKDIWGSADIYPIKPLVDPPTSEKQSDLLITSDTLYKWKTDIYGNEFALFKTTHPTKLTSEQQNSQFTTAAIQEANPDTFVSLITGGFTYPETEMFRHQLSDYTTVFENTTSPMSASLDCYDKRQLATNRFFYRNVYSSEIAPASSALSAVFIKYTNDDVINNEIQNKVVDIDIINDVIILETSNYLILEKYTYDLTTNTFTSILPLMTYISVISGNNTYEKFTNHWYDESSDNIFLGKTVLHPFLSGSNNKAIYPQIHVFNNKLNTFNETFSLKTLMPAVSTAANLYNNQETYNLLKNAGFVVGTPYTPVPLTQTESINISRTDKPLISVNSLENTLSFIFFGYDPSDTSYLYNMYFDTADSQNLEIKQLDMFTPNKQGLFNYNLANYADNIAIPGTTDQITLSAMIEGTFNRGANENRVILLDALQSEVQISGELDAHTLVHSSPISGRDINPSGYKDLSRGTIRMGAGLSASQSDVHGKASTEVTGTSIEPYTHNASYLVFSPALTGIGNEIVVSFDVAMYTNTNANSAYAQIAT